ncbi:hypothetical protein V8E51_015951 [Hyaloscypha variabilis]
MQKHTDRGVHSRVQLQNFVVIDGIRFEAVTAPMTTFKGAESHQMAIAEHLDTSTKSAAISNDTNPPGHPVQLETVSRSMQESKNNLGRHDHVHRSINETSIPLHRQNTHLKEKHLGSQDSARFECNHCSKRFTRSHTLAEHGRIHNGERPFGCSQCPKTFTRLKNRNRHQILHSGEKRFICKGNSDTGQQLGCHRSFAREDCLLSHLRSESAFQCIEPLLNVAAEHIIHLTEKGGEKDQYCPNPPNGCGLPFALPYFDHKRDSNRLRKTSTGSNRLQVEITPSSAVKSSSDLDLSSSVGKRSPVPEIIPSETSDSSFPHVNETVTFDFAADNFNLNARKLPEDLCSETGISIYQTTTSAGEYGFLNDPLGSFAISGQPRDVGLRIEGYNPARGMAGDILQVKVGSFFPLLSVVFNIQIGFSPEAVPRLQNMNAVPASVVGEGISPKFFYRYTLSARVPYPKNQPRMSPLPIILEINGLQRYGGEILELLEVGHFTYDEVCGVLEAAS